MDNCEHCGRPGPAAGLACEACHLRAGEPIRHIITTATRTSVVVGDLVIPQLNLRDIVRNHAAEARLSQLQMDYVGSDKQPNTIRLIFSCLGNIGCLEPDLGRMVMAAWKVGCKFGCYLVEVTGDPDEPETLGAKLLLLHYSPQTSMEAACEYLHERRLAHG